MREDSLDHLLQIQDLKVEFHLREGTIRAVDGVNLDVPHRATVGVVGESGCGKTMMARAILGILPAKGKVTGGRILLAPQKDDKNHRGRDILGMSPRGKAIRSIRGREIAMIFQEPMTALSPVHTVGNQIMESILLHQKTTRAQAKEQALYLLGRVGVPNPSLRIKAFPHELSGGLRQRSMIAKALCCRPRLLIADEPTTALDVTIQAQILDLLLELQEELGMSVMMITHDLGVIAETADQVAVLYMGRVVEKANAVPLFESPLHPYTVGLLASVPVMGRPSEERLASIRGSVLDPFSQVQGCPFHPRCQRCVRGRCDVGDPPSLVEVSSEHWVACFQYEGTS